MESEIKVVNVSGEDIKMISDMASCKKDLFVYLDPPYYPVCKTKSGKIAPYKLYNGDFLPVDFLKLKMRCDDLTKNNIPFILSNSDCEFIKILFKDYVVVEIDEPRGLKGKKHPKERCLIITNFRDKEHFMESIKKMNDLKGNVGEEHERDKVQGENN